MSSEECCRSIDPPTHHMQIVKEMKLVAPDKSPSSPWSVLRELVNKGKLWSKGGPLFCMGSKSGWGLRRAGW